MKYASDFRQIARDALRGNWSGAILTGFVASLLGASLWGGGGSSGSSASNSGSAGDLFRNIDSATLDLIVSVLLVVGSILVIWGIVTLVIGGAAKLGYAIYNLNLVDGKEARFSDLFSQFGRIGSGFIMNLLMGVFIFLWSLLFVIPGIIKSYSYAMTPFILAEHPEISENEAITRSRHLMDGNKLRLFCLMLSFIGWELLFCVPFLVSVVLLASKFAIGVHVALTGTIIFCGISFVLLFVGQLFLVPYQHAALAAFYRDISAEYDRCDHSGSVLPGEVI